MTGARKFLFGEDFRGPTPEDVAEREAAAEAAHQAALRRAFEDGVEEGRRQAAAETERRLAIATERLAGEASARFAALDVAVEQVETEALAYFDALARRLAGSALASQPLAAVADAAATAFRHLRGVPHLVARVGTPLVDDTEELLRRSSREHGFEGRIIVVGDEELGPGDVRLEWAEGGVARDQTRFETALGTALAAATAGGGAKDENGWP
jgi:flagellar assembly protein FliH